MYTYIHIYIYIYVHEYIYIYIYIYIYTYIYIYVDREGGDRLRVLSQLDRYHSTHDQLRGLPSSIHHGEISMLLPNNQRQHRTLRAPKDVLPLRICASTAYSTWNLMFNLKPTHIQLNPHVQLKTHTYSTLNSYVRLKTHTYSTKNPICNLKPTHIQLK